MTSGDEAQGWDEAARNETRQERLDRNFEELLQELRVAQTGVQFLFAFLLSLVFAARFGQLHGVELTVYGVAIVCAALASCLLIAPVANHRLLFRHHAKEGLVSISHRLTLAGLGFLALAMTSSLLLVLEVALGWAWSFALTSVVGLGFTVFWVVVPLRIRRGAHRSEV